jgi:hypothetical protein
VSPTDRIVDADKLKSVFGYWPSFHDAEVVDLEFDRAGPTVTADIHLFEMTKKVSTDGYYVCRKHCVARLRFLIAQDIRFDGFNHQNALSGLSIVEKSDSQNAAIQFDVGFDSAYGVDLSFVCSEIVLVVVTPGIPRGSIYKEYRD